MVRDLQQLTVNVFQMQGVLPATLDESLVLVDDIKDDEAPTASLLYRESRGRRSTIVWIRVGRGRRRGVR